ncbi:MAG TPA: hypothetical protein VFR85_03345 [Anaeromyxobacteraceae bacterium]|nr:hypothetical protein [Anaeromyxobacteraceae bacterium]
MTRDRLRRFLNIERPRRPGEEPAAAEAPERFRRLERPAAPPAEPPVPPSATDRFRPPPERPLDVAEPAEGEQPFRRCAGCEMDNARFAETCQNCGADLRTPEQDAFNQRLWAARRQEAAEEARVIAERAAERERLAAEERKARVELATEMARMEGDRVEGEMDRAWGGERWGRWRGWGRDAPYDPDAPWGGPPRAPMGLRWLRAIKNPLLRIAVIVAAVALPVLLIVLGRRNGGEQLAGMIILMVLFALVSPPGWRYRRRRWWGW